MCRGWGPAGWGSTCTGCHQRSRTDIALQAAGGAGGDGVDGMTQFVPNLSTVALETPRKRMSRNSSTHRQLPRVGRETVERRRRPNGQGHADPQADPGAAQTGAVLTPVCDVAHRPLQGPRALKAGREREQRYPKRRSSHAIDCICQAKREGSGAGKFGEGRGAAAFEPPGAARS